MFAKMRLFIILTLVGFSVMIPYATAANLVVNPGFETGNFSGWTLAGNTGFTAVDTTNPHSGTYSAHFGAIGSDTLLTQTQNFATTPGAQYTLDFWLRNDGGTPNDFSVTWGVQSLVSQTNLGPFGWTEYQYSIVAPGASTALQFGFRQDPAFFHLDDVSLELKSVPEPVSMLLLGFGIIGLLGARRLKK
jgi:hypothetical protein